MDIISHALLGGAVVADQKLLLPAILFGAGPDILNGVPVHLAVLRILRKDGKKWKEVLPIILQPDFWRREAPSWTHTSYLYIHSLLFAGATALLLFLIYPPWLPLMKAWLLHIGLDYFTHKDWYAVKPLYPFSEWNIGFFNWFKTPLKYVGIPLSVIIFWLVYF